MLHAKNHENERGRNLFFPLRNYSIAGEAKFIWQKINKCMIKANNGCPILGSCYYAMHDLWGPSLEASTKELLLPLEGGGHQQFKENSINLLRIKQGVDDRKGFHPRSDARTGIGSITSFFKLRSLIQTVSAFEAPRKKSSS